MSNGEDVKKAESDQDILDRLIAKKHKVDGPWFEFDGQNCEEPCQGWDGYDRRCECGNRRVTWVLSDDKTRVWAEAW